ncbi:MAG: HlyC/CorC family transporter [Phycisphaerales bacterium]|nr:HlyC/CorC family transporter [Phycisphaerales bacterium]
MTAGWWLILAAFMVVGSAISGSVVYALSTLSRSKLASAAGEDAHQAKLSRLDIIQKDPEGHAAPIAMLRLVFQSMTIVSMVFWAGAMRGEQTPGWVSIAIGLALSNIVLWVFSTLVSFGVAKHNGERTVVILALPIRVLHALFTPVLPIGAFMNEVIRRLSDADEKSDDLQISAQILSVVTEGELDGHIDETERDMLEAVVEFRSTLVESIMTPRTEVDALRYTDDLAEVQGYIDEHGHSRVPVYEESLDQIRGIVYAKDLLRWITQHGNNGQTFVLGDILREPTFVPETKTVRELLAQLLADKVHIAIIIDEYGGTSGLVTIEDIVEEIFGEIQDEYEGPEDEVGGVVVNEHARSAVIDARTDIDDANDELDSIGIELPESDDYDTVAGFVNTTAGRIPDVGETLRAGPIEIEILEAEPTRVISLRISLAQDDESAEPSTIEQAADQPGK